MERISSSISLRSRVTDTRPLRRVRRSNTRSPRDPRVSKRPASPTSSLPDISEPTLRSCDSARGPRVFFSRAGRRAFPAPPGVLSDPCYDLGSMPGRSLSPPRRHACLLIAVSVALMAAARCGDSSPASTIAQARRLREAGRPAEAATLLTDLVRRVPRDFTAHYELAQAWRSEEHTSELQS